MFEERDPIFEEENQKRLIEQVQTAPDCKIYGVSRIDQGMIRRTKILMILSALVLIILAFIFLNPILAGILFILILTITLIVYAILSYLNHSHKYFKIFVSELGIAKQSIWDEGAIPWDKIEFIEVKNKGNGIDLIIFRVGLKTLSYRNSHFATRLTIEIISEYIGGIDTWQIVEDLGEFTETTNSDRFYMKPDLEKSEGQKRLEEILLREWIGDQDFDADQTQDHPYAKTDEELFKMILNDPQCTCIKDTGRFTRTLANFRTICVIFIIAIGLTFVGMGGGQFSWLVWITVISLFVVTFYGMCKSDERLFISPIGIVRYYFGSPEALEWKHVEFIDFHTNGGSPVPFEFFGNKKRVYCPRHCYKELLILDHILQYLPELNQWKKVTQYNLEDGTFRLLRPEV